jgi:hypothetical protein
MIYRLMVSDAPGKFGNHGRKNNEIQVEARSHTEGIARLNALVSEKYGFPLTPPDPVRIRGRRRTGPIPLLPVSYRVRRFRK